MCTKVILIDQRKATDNFDFLMNIMPLIDLVDLISYET